MADTVLNDKLGGDLPEENKLKGLKGLAVVLKYYICHQVYEDQKLDPV